MVNGKLKYLRCYCRCYLADFKRMNALTMQQRALCCNANPTTMFPFLSFFITDFNIILYPPARPSFFVAVIT